MSLDMKSAGFEETFDTIIAIIDLSDKCTKGCQKLQGHLLDSSVIYNSSNTLHKWRVKKS